MNIIGFLFIGAFAALLIFLGVRKPQKKDYSQYPTTDAEVVLWEDFHGRRWIVEFEDEKGNSVLGMTDDVQSYYLFKDTIGPKRGQIECVYYWPYDRKSTYRVNRRAVEYWIHFCNSDYDNCQEKLAARSRRGITVIGIILSIAALMVLFS